MSILSRFRHKFNISQPISWAPRLLTCGRRHRQPQKVRKNQRSKSLAVPKCVGVFSGGVFFFPRNTKNCVLLFVQFEFRFWRWETVKPFCFFTQWKKMRGISQCWDNYLIDLAPDNNSTCEEAEYEEKLRWRYTSVLMHHQEAQKNK